MTDNALAIRFARRELRAGLAGFYVFILCLVLGVAAIAAVQSVSRSLGESLRHDGRQILGGDIALRSLYKPLADAEMAWLSARATGVTVVAETRAMVRSRDESRTSLAELKAVEDTYPLYGRLEVFDGKGSLIDTPPARLMEQDADGNWGAVAPQELLAKLGLQLGDAVMIGPKEFILRGLYRKLPDDAASISLVMAPHLLISRAGLADAGLTGTGNPVSFETRLALPGRGTPRDLAAFEKDVHKQFPAAQWRVRNFYNASPRLERYIDRLTFFLTLIGLTTLVVGGVGISNAVRAYLDTKLANIATLKCLGAPSSFIFRVYMYQVLALAAGGAAVGIAIGAGAAHIAVAALGEKLSLDAQSGIYPDAIGIAALSGLLVTLCFSLWPVGRAINVAPADLFRDAIAPRSQSPSLRVLAGIIASAVALAVLAIATAPDMRLAGYFTAGTTGAIGAFLLCAEAARALLSRLPVPRRPETRMAVANLTRPGNVTSGAILSLGLGLSVLMTIALVEHNFSRLLGDDLSVDAPSFFFLDIQNDQLNSFRSIVAATPSARNLTLAPNLRGRIVAVNGRDAEQALVNKSYDWVIRSDRGFTYAAEQPAHSRIEQGAWWNAAYNGPPLVSVATDVARAFNIGVGDDITVEILGDSITAKIANVREIEWASFTMNFAVTFAPGALDAMSASYIATLILGPEDETGLQARLARELPSVTSIRVREALAAAENILGAILLAVRVSAAVTLMAGALVLAGGVAAARRRHIYDAVVLKVLGASRGRIARTFLLEYGILGLVTIFLAAAIGTAASWAVLTHVMNLPWKFSMMSLTVVSLSCFGLTIAAGLFSTWRALSQKPAPWLRNQ